MANFNFNSNRLAELEGKMNAFIYRDHGDDDDDDDDDEDGHVGQTRVLIAILQDACNLVRDAEGFAPDFKTIVDRVDQLINSAVHYAYNDGKLCDFMPSFAHSEANPEVDGHIIQLEEGQIVLHNHQLDMLKSFITIVKRHAGELFDAEQEGKIPKGPEPWSESTKPHPLTTRLSRFRGDLTTSATSDQPLANVIYQARCEITSDSTPSPIGLTISANGTVLVAHGKGGHKIRAPSLWYYFPTAETTDLPAGHHVRLGLSDIAYWTTTDEERKLIFAADRNRIKSYAWGPPSGKHYRDVLPTHTMDTGHSEGPLAVLSGGRLVRAGKGSVAVWNLDTLPTHGAKGKTRINKAISLNTWRDDPECIERSSGSPADTTIKLELSNLLVAVWHPHPSVEGNMILTADTRNSPCYSCVSVDLEHGGKTVVKYIGHGASVNAIATSPGDPNMFVTASEDGFARLFDVRHSLPVLTLKAGHPSGGCPAVVMIHPDGIPTVFTGSGTSEHIKLWDIRARQAVYELSTGNNGVSAMAWDTAHNSLYAVTECQYMDYLGHTSGYRRAKVPRDQDPEGDELDQEGDELYSEDDGYEGRCWPKTAHHGEDYFGYLFDAGEHSIYKYSFKENATNVVPPYGQATLDSDSCW